MAAKKKENKKMSAPANGTMPPADESSTGDRPNELDEPRWSVITFEGRKAGGLTYDEAVKKVSELEAARVAGLCIITDEAAARMSKRS